MENGGPITKTEENFWFDGIHDWGEKKRKKERDHWLSKEATESS